MLHPYREAFNRAFSAQRYEAFLEQLNTTYGHPVRFRVAESPIFLPREVKQSLLRAADDVIDLVCRPDFKALTEAAIQPQHRVPAEDEHTLFMCIDFAITRGEDGRLLPQLIEFQGFPSLFGYKSFLADVYRQHFPIPEHLTPYFGGLTPETYRERVRRAIVAGCDLEQVILLEIEPMQQNTAIDFAVSEQMFGVKPVCLSALIRRGTRLYYREGGREIPVKRIYNRVIFDELEQRPDLVRQFNLIEPVDVSWAGHPNWYSRISKYCMPMLNSPYVPSSRLLSDFDTWPADLEHYVLKPLYSFSGSGVKFHVSVADLEEIAPNQRHLWMLQRKVQYEPIIETTDEGRVKIEIRLLCLWEPGRARPEPVINLVRMSRGEMIGVKYNMNKTWVGGSIAFMEPD